MGFIIRAARNYACLGASDFVAGEETPRMFDRYWVHADFYWIVSRIKVIGKYRNEVERNYDVSIMITNVKIIR